MNELLELRDVSYRIGNKFILENISFTLKQGEYISILGPNGSGKTTLLKLILRIMPVTSGVILLAGQPLDSFSRKSLARHLAYVPQSQPQLFPFTVHHFVCMSRYAYLSPLGMLNADDLLLVKNAIMRTGLTGMEQRTLDTLSGGELQRVWLAASLAQDAETLLLDEPGSQLDYAHQEALSSILADLHRTHGKTLLQITHDINRAVLDSQRILALRSGRILYDGSPQGFMKEDVLRRVYGVSLRLLNDPQTGRSLAVPGFTVT